MDKSNETKCVELNSTGVFSKSTNHENIGLQSFYKMSFFPVGIAGNNHYQQHFLSLFFVVVLNQAMIISKIIPYLGGRGGTLGQHMVSIPKMITFLKGFSRKIGEGYGGLKPSTVQWYTL
jgi:hypothetical protein